MSCQDKMDRIALFNELKCPEEESTTFATFTTTTPDEIIVSTTEELNTHAPVVAIDPNIKVLTIEKLSFDDEEILHEINDNQLDIVAKKGDDLMMGDQPDVEVFSTTSGPSDDTNIEDKKVLLKMTMKKEIEPKKKGNLKKAVKDEERMMGDAPAEPTTVDEKIESSTTDRQRRDAEETTQPITVSTEEINVSSTLSNDLSTIEDASSTVETTTEILTTTTIPTTTTEQPTTKFIVQGHPLFHSQTIFKDPIPQENPNANLERKDVLNNEDHFVPPMLLVKTRFMKEKETDDAKETTTETVTDSGFDFNITDITDDNSTDIVLLDFLSTEISKIPSTTEEPTNVTTATSTEISSSTTTETSNDVNKPIKVEKRNDPRLGLNAVKMTSKPPAYELTTVEFLSTSSQEPEVEDISSSTTESETVEEISSSSIATTDGEDEINVSSISTLPDDTTSSEQATTEPISEKLIATNEPALSSSTTLISTAMSTDVSKLTEIVNVEVEVSSSSVKSEEPLAKLIEISSTTERETLSTTVKPTTTTTISAQFNNEINDHFDGEIENSREDENTEHHHVENNLNNADFQPYKPIRHRSFTKQDHHHGAIGSIGRILGRK
jgi:hypothetical protein